MIGERFHPILYFNQTKRKRRIKYEPSQTIPTCFGRSNFGMH